MQNRLIKSGYLFLIFVLLLVAGVAAVQAQDEQPGSGNTVFLPGVFNGSMEGHMISGRVLNSQSIPIAGVTIRTDMGQNAITDQNGYYSLDRLGGGVYTLTPHLGGCEFSPASAEVVVPPDAILLNFTAAVDCAEAIVNGGFEDNTGWEIPITEYPAGYSSAEAHTGNRSMRTGIVIPADNTYSYSSTRQRVTIPSGTVSAVLGFWIKPFSGEAQGLSLPPQPEAGSPFGSTPLAGDVQYVLVLDNAGNIIDTLLWQLSDSRTWTEYQFNLAAFAGQTIWLHFGTYNDGWNGISSMYVDDVSLDVCPGGGSPTPTPPPGPCGNLFDNPSFETVSDWEIPITAYPAGYSTDQAHTGSWSMRTGIVKPADNVYSYSDFRQSVYIPSGAPRATARFWLYTLSGEARNLSQPPMITPTGRPFNETVLSGDLQYVLVLDQYQNWIDTLVWQRSAEGYWHYYEFDLRRYAGQVIYLQFGTYNDGYNGITSMHVDDVSLDDCLYTPTPGPTGTATLPPTSTPIPTNTPIPTITPTPGPCQELIVNNNFDGTNGWEILNTHYPASYTYAQYHSPWRSMRTGIVNPADNTYSYSDFRQVVSIPSNTHTVTLGMWAYPISGESPLSPLPAPPQTQFFGFEQLEYDVQYLLILDQNQNWIDTLMWMRSNSQVWTYMQYDLTNYAGWRIMLQWGTYNNGYGGITAMYVDDVTLQSCP